MSYVIGALILALVLWPFVRRALALLILRGAVRTVARGIGEDALARVPDRIQLERRNATAWSNRAAADALATPLLDAGFEDAGTFAVGAMPGVICRLMVEPRDAIGAAIYEHPKAGTWLELVTRYADGATASFSTLKPTGMAPRPGHTSVHAPGTQPLALLERMRAERPLKTLAPLTAATYPRTFEAAYAEHMAWRKRMGVSAEDVVAVAKNRKAA
ncbi:MAG: hypothetical protein HYR74_12385 [Candidatus Eisenbacteria bacterium]|nr:hypothetical protein [Candidatus Eisenbacteria bacterium]